MTESGNCIPEGTLQVHRITLTGAMQENGDWRYGRLYRMLYCCTGRNVKVPDKHAS
ncbi:hypothetical protein JW948_00545 [bacterium]|nr:hypothetical protein [bacterium]